MNDFKILIILSWGKRAFSLRGHNDNLFQPEFLMVEGINNVLSHGFNISVDPNIPCFNDKKSSRDKLGEAFFQKPL